MSKRAKWLLCALAPCTIICGFAIWVHGKTVSRPAFLDKYGFTLEQVYEDDDLDQHVYKAELPLASVEADFVREMRGRGFKTDRTDQGRFVRIDVFNGGMMFGYLGGNGESVGFCQYKIHSLAHRIQLATGWKLSP